MTNSKIVLWKPVQNCLRLWLGNIIRDHKEWYVFNNKNRTFNEEISLKGIMKGMKGGSSLTRQSYCQIHVELFQTLAIYLSIHRWTFVLCTLGLRSFLSYSTLFFDIMNIAICYQKPRKSTEQNRNMEIELKRK